MNDGIKEFYGRNIQRRDCTDGKDKRYPFKDVEQQDRIIEEVARLSLSPFRAVSV